MAHSILTLPFFHDEAKAYEKLESIVWPDGPTCPHCDSVEKIGKLTGKTARPGLRKCYNCRKQFTVTVGTVFESSHVKLHLWLQAAYLLCSSKKGISSNQLARTLGVTVKTGWFMSQRLRAAMAAGQLPPIGGEGKAVEADETFISRKEGRRKMKGYAHKRAIMSLVERGGELRSFHIERANTENVREIIIKHVKRDSSIMTDEAPYYRWVHKDFANHQAVNHRDEQWVHGAAHTNTLEGFFSIFKRGMKGVYQHCSERHLHRYLAEFDFRYNNRIARGIDDAQRTATALRGIVGKRLTYRD